MSSDLGTHKWVWQVPEAVSRALDTLGREGALCWRGDGGSRQMRVVSHQCHRRAGLRQQARFWFALTELRGPLHACSSLLCLSKQRSARGHEALGKCPPTCMEGEGGVILWWVPSTDPIIPVGCSWRDTPSLNPVPPKSHRTAQQGIAYKQVRGLRPSLVQVPGPWSFTKCLSLALAH